MLELFELRAQQDVWEALRHIDDPEIHRDDLFRAVPYSTFFQYQVYIELDFARQFDGVAGKRKVKGFRRYISDVFIVAYLFNDLCADKTAAHRVFPKRDNLWRKGGVLRPLCGCAAAEHGVAMARLVGFALVQVGLLYISTFLVCPAIGILGSQYAGGWLSSTMAREELKGSRWPAEDARGD